MELDKFLIGLKKLDGEIVRKTRILENDSKKGFQSMTELLQDMTELLPEWIFFIGQTGIGTKEDIFCVLQDMENAMQRRDTVLLADTLLFGLQARTGEYIRIIEEALYDK